MNAFYQIDYPTVSTQRQKYTKALCARHVCMAPAVKDRDRRVCYTHPVPGVLLLPLLRHSNKDRGSQALPVYMIATDHGLLTPKPRGFRAQNV